MYGCLCFLVAGLVGRFADGALVCLYINFFEQRFESSWDVISGVLVIAAIRRYSV